VRSPVVLGALLLLSLSLPSAAQPAEGSEAQMSDRYLRAQMAALRIPGIAVAVVKDGRIVLERSYGTASVEFSQPVRTDTVFAINSITKAFTGVAVMRLVQQGRLDLAAPIGRYLDGLPPAWRGVTLQQLLSHMSGLPDVLRAPTVETDSAAAWAWTLAQPVTAPAGERFQYCQTNYALIQRLLNQLEGRAADAPLALEQMRQAGMQHTFYGDDTTVIPNKAPTYRWSGGGMDEAPVLNVFPGRFLPARRAASGMNSTAGDMARWIVMLQQNGLLDKANTEAMWTPVRFNNGQPGKWGIGWEVLQHGGRRTIGMSGGGRAAVSLYPEFKLGVVILTNLAGAYPDDMVDKLASIYAPGLDLTGVPALRIGLEDHGYGQIKTVAAAIEARRPGLVWPEVELNDWGYRLLASRRLAEGLAVLGMAAERYPASGNAHDSLAEALLLNGDKDGARRHYTRAVELDPKNEGARRHLAELGGGTTVP